MLDIYSKGRERRSLSAKDEAEAEGFSDKEGNVAFEHCDKSEQKSEQTEALEQRLSELQREIRAAGIPVIIAFEGWSAAGKGTMIGRLLRSLDPRGFKVFSMVKPSPDEERYPEMHRFWVRLPSAGNIVIFDRSWYRNVFLEKQKSHAEENERRIMDILDFETQLASEGYVILKFFLHISQKEQEKRFERLKSVKATKWRVGKSDIHQNEHYDKLYDSFCRLLDATDSKFAPWRVILSGDIDKAALEVYSDTISELERALKRKAAGLPINSDLPSLRLRGELLPTANLDEVDLSVNADHIDYKKRLKECQLRMFELQNELYQRRIPLIIAYEGWDASGKGGNIKRVTQAMDPRGCEVIPIASPSTEEKSRHFLWRFWKSLPKTGHTAIFDRTWYGRVLVERIEGFASDEEWQRAYDEINSFEAGLVNYGAIVIKFWLHIDSDEQLARFTARQNTPSKRWKITDEDWRNRSKWNEYEIAVNEMLQKTSTVEAPWIVVESNDKKYARIRVLEELISIISRRLEQ